jgi:anthranilate/para-aminobenzoate synthase component I
MELIAKLERETRGVYAGAGQWNKSSIETIGPNHSNIFSRLFWLQYSD